MEYIYKLRNVRGIPNDSEDGVELSRSVTRGHLEFFNKISSSVLLVVNQKCTKMIQKFMTRIAVSAIERNHNFDEHISSSSNKDSVKFNAMTWIFPYVYLNQRKRITSAFVVVFTWLPNESSLSTLFQQVLWEETSLFFLVINHFIAATTVL